MRTTNEYLPCPHPSCDGWARVERGGKGYRDRLICLKCGTIVVDDNLPKGQQLRLKESENTDNQWNDE